MIFKMRSFTLIEIIIVIIIIGILSTLAVTQYTPARERAVSREAVSTLRLIAAAERIYRMEIDGNAFTNCQCACAGTAATCCNNPVDGCNVVLKLDLSPQNWSYSAINATAANFNGQAVRTNGSGCQHTIDENGNENPPTPGCP